jgi:hypothetical protein
MNLKSLSYLMNLMSRMNLMNQRNLTSHYILMYRSNLKIH